MKRKNKFKERLHSLKRLEMIEEEDYEIITEAIEDKNYENICNCFGIKNITKKI